MIPLEPIVCKHGETAFCRICDNDPEDPTDWDREDAFQTWVSNPARAGRGFDG